MVRDNSVLVNYKYDEESVSQIQPTVLIKLILTILKRKSDPGEPVNDKEILHPETFAACLQFLDITCALIDYIINMEDEYLRDFDEIAQKSNVTFEGVLILTDLSFRCLWKYLSSLKSFSNGDLEVTMRHLEDLFVKFALLAPTIENDAEISTKYFLCQIISRGCLIIQALVGLTDSNDKHYKGLSRFTAIIQNMCPLILLSRYSCGEMSRDIILQYWITCVAVMGKIVRTCSPSPIANSPLQSDTAKTCFTDTLTIITTRTESMDASRILVLKGNCINRIRHSLLSTLPTPQEMFMEVCRLKTCDLKYSTVTTADQRGALGSALDDPNVDLIIFPGLELLRVKHVLVGLQHMLRVGTIDSREHSLSVPNKEDWIAPLAECLFLLLSSAACAATFDMNAAETLSTDELLMQLAPLIAEIFFQIIVGTDLSSNYDWIFWELTKRLTQHVEFCRKIDTIQVMHDQPSPSDKQSTRMDSYRSDEYSYIDSSRLSSKNRYGGRASNVNALKDKLKDIEHLNHDLKVERGLKDSDDDMQNSKGSESAMSSPDIVTKLLQQSAAQSSSATDLSCDEFSVGAEVFGRCAVGNGERWFPGKVHLCNSDGSFYIIFKDGTEEKRKPISELRLKNMRGRRSQPTEAPPPLNMSSGGGDRDRQSGVNSRRISLPSLKSDNVGSSFDNEDILDLDKDTPQQNPGLKFESLTPLKALKPLAPLAPISPLPILQTDASPAAAAEPDTLSHVLSIGDAVDGQCEVASGAKRWFRGTISSVNADGTYGIDYNDGDKDAAKAASEIRPSKSKTFKKPNRSPKSAAVEDSVEASPLKTLPSLKLKPTTPTRQFVVGDAVDGQCEVSNGGKRWFPGKIVAVNSDGTFGIEYNDGDRDAAKSEAEIRYSKSRTDASSADASSTSKAEGIDIAAVNTSSGSHVLSIGDAVDGQCEVASGAKRWFRGTISSVNADGTYGIDYNDGDKDAAKAASEIRLPKSKSPKRKSEKSPKSGSVGGGGVSPSGLTSLKDLPSLSLGHSKHEPMSVKNSPFSVGDTVDGHCEVSSGAKRWFPGKISAVNLDGTFAIDYMDGDKDQAVKVEDIRTSNIRKDHMKAVEAAYKSKPVDEAHVNAVSSFAVGDSVDGQCEVSSGAKRWFPGTISSVNADGTFGIDYADGDKDAAKNASMIRKSRTTSSALQAAASVKAEKATLTQQGGSESSPEKASKSQAKTESPRGSSTSKSGSGIRALPLGRLSSVSGTNPYHNPLPLIADADGDTTSTSQPGKSKENSEIMPKDPKETYDVSADDDSDDDDICFTIPSMFAEDRSKKQDDAMPAHLKIGNVEFASVAEFAGAPGGSLSAGLMFEAQPSESSSMATTTQTMQLNMMKFGNPNANSRGRANSRGDAFAPGQVRSHSLTSSSNTTLDFHAQSRIPHLKQTAGSPYGGNEDDETHAMALGIPDPVLRAFSLISMILMRRAISDRHFLDTTCCTARVLSSTGMHFSAPLANTYNNGSTSSRFDQSPSGRSQSRFTHRSDGGSARQYFNPNPKSHINLTFNVREYIEMQKEGKFQLFQETANAVGPSMTRLMKLMSEEYFKDCCLPSHLGSAVKVGEGGFGSICKITCPFDCSKTEGRRLFSTDKDGEFLSKSHIQNKRRSWLKCSCPKNCHHKGILSVNSLHGDEDKEVETGHVYAVKRIPRERSVHDSNSLQSLFNEITCLEVLSHVKGVCKLIDYGTFGGEYWIVLELAGVNLSEWRRRTMETGGLAPFRKTLSGLRDIDSDRLASAVENFSEDVLNPRDTGLCLALYLDILLIVKSVHEKDVAHFDIKCNNCVLRMAEDASNKTHSKKVNLSPEFHKMRAAHAKGTPSGNILLIDFGESYPFISTPKARQSIKEFLQKCRGTMAIQAPEILCISADGGGNIPSQVKFPSPSKKSDLWSLGCLLVELMSGKYLFGDRTWPDLFINLCKTKFTERSIPKETLRHSLRNLPYKLQTGIEEIAMATLKQLPNERASIDDLIKMVDALLEPKGYLAALHDNPLPVLAEYDNEKDYYGIKILAEVASQTAEIRRKDVLIAERVLFQVLPTPFHPEYLITSPTMSQKLRPKSNGDNNKRSLFNSKMSAPRKENLFSMGGTGSLRAGSKEDNQKIYDGVDHLIILSDLERAHRDATLRRITTWMSLTRVVHIIFVLSKSDYELAVNEIRAQGLSDNVWPMLIKIDEPSEIQDSIVEVYTIANEAMYHGNKLVISVCPQNEVVDALAATPELRAMDPNAAPPNPLRASGSEKIGKHSKLALSIGFALADALGMQNPCHNYKRGSMMGVSATAKQLAQAKTPPSQPVSARIGNIVSGISSKGTHGTNTPSQPSGKTPTSLRFTASSKHKFIGAEMGKANLAKVYETADNKDAAICQSLSIVAPDLERVCCQRVIDFLFDAFEEVEEPIFYGAV
jgi:hypothetical protein